MKLLKVPVAPSDCRQLRLLFDAVRLSRLKQLASRWLRLRSELLTPVLETLLRQVMRFAILPLIQVATLPRLVVRSPERLTLPSTLAAAPPSRSLHLQIDGENRSGSSAAEQVCDLFLNLLSLIPPIRSLLRVPKFPVRCRREFTPEVPSWRAQLTWRLGRKWPIPANSLYFSLLAGNPAAETGSQQTASSAI